jgi:isocitrate lyase
MLAYNLSPSFNWDTTGMSEEEMRRFPEELGRLGYVFNFITYGGHQIDGLAGEEFATALRDDGMLALVRLQRKLRLIDSPYRTPQTHVGGPRLDAGLFAATGGTATTKAMGKGSTQFQHLVETEVPPGRLEEWISLWSTHYDMAGKLRVTLRPHIAGSDLLELSVVNADNTKLANIIFAVLQDRRLRNILSVRDQNTFSLGVRQKRLMTLNTLFLIHRYKAVAIHYVSPTDDNQHLAAGIKELGIYADIQTEVGQIIVAQVDAERVRALVQPESEELRRLITKALAQSFDRA